MNLEKDMNQFKRYMLLKRYHAFIKFQILELAIFHQCQFGVITKTKLYKVSCADEDLTFFRENNKNLDNH